MFALANYSAISPFTFYIARSVDIISMLFDLAAFIERKKLVSEIPCLAKGSYLTIFGAVII